MISNVSGLTAIAILPTEHEDASRPVILGPDATVPGHPGWCLLHDRQTGAAGISVCFSETHDVDGLPGGRREYVGAFLAQATGSAPEVHTSVNGRDGAVLSLPAAREYAALLNYLVAQGESAAVN